MMESQNIDTILQQALDVERALEKAEKYGKPNMWNHYYTEAETLERMLLNFELDKNKPVNIYDTGRKARPATSAP